MGLQHVSKTATVEEAAEVVREHGHVIIDELATPEAMDELVSEMQPYIDASAWGERPWGYKSRRTGRLIERSKVARELVTNPLVLGLAQTMLAHAPGIQIGATEMISLDPGAEAQPLHRDEAAFGFFPFPPDYEVSFNRIWALTDFTEENGATRVVPGSHKGALVDPANVETFPAEMKKGSVMIFSGKLWHSGGNNLSDGPRRAQAFNYAANWVRQEENQFLACSREVARTLPLSLLKLMGYEAIYGIGHAGGQQDPLEALLES